MMGSKFYISLYKLGFSLAKLLALKFKNKNSRKWFTDKTGYIRLQNSWIWSTQNIFENDSTFSCLHCEIWKIELLLRNKLIQKAVYRGLRQNIKYECKYRVSKIIIIQRNVKNVRISLKVDGAAVFTNENYMKLWQIRK